MDFEAHDRAVIADLETEITRLHEENTRIRAAARWMEKKNNG